MTREELEARAAEIDAIPEDSIINAMDDETVRSLKEERKNIETQLAELRAAAAAEEEKRAQLAKTAKPIEAPEERKNTNMYGIESKEYRDAYLKNLQGKAMTEEERSILMNAQPAEMRATMTSDTSSVGYAIPTMTLDRIITNMVKIAPILGEINLMHIQGNVKLPVENNFAAADIHTEGTAMTPASDTITSVDLGAYDITKLLSISANVRVMATPAFEDWVVDNLSRALAIKIEDYVINGTGTSMPKGIDYAETWTDGTNAVDFAAAAPTAAELSEMIGLINAAYAANAKFLMNWTDFWKVYELRDDKNPAIVEKVDGVWYIHGFPVLISSKVAAGDVFFGDFHEGVYANMPQNPTVERDEHSGFRSHATDFLGSCLFDCKPIPGRIIKGANTL